MAIVPQRRIGKTRKRKRRTHFKLDLPGIMTCPNCGEAKLSHTVCKACGFYDGKQVLEIKASQEAEEAVEEKPAKKTKKVKAEEAEVKTTKKATKKVEAEATEKPVKKAAKKAEKAE